MERAGPYAVLLHGLVGAPEAAPSVTLRRRESAGVGAVAIAAASVIENVLRLRANRNAGVFVHSWNPSIGAQIDRRYRSWLLASQHDEPDPNRPKALSQSLSVARAARLMSAHEASRGRAYALVVVLRLDAVIGAPLPLERFDVSAITFPTMCCVNDPVNLAERAGAEAACGSKRQGFSWGPNRRTVLGPCRVSDADAAQSRPSSGAARPARITRAASEIEFKVEVAAPSRPSRQGRAESAAVGTMNRASRQLRTGSYESPKISGGQPSPKISGGQPSPGQPSPNASARRFSAGTLDAFTSRRTNRNSVGGGTSRASTASEAVSRRMNRYSSTGGGDTNREGGKRNSLGRYSAAEGLRNSVTERCSLSGARSSSATPTDPGAAASFSAAHDTVHQRAAHYGGALASATQYIEQSLAAAERVASKANKGLMRSLHRGDTMGGEALDELLASQIDWQALLRDPVPLHAWAAAAVAGFERFAHVYPGAKPAALLCRAALVGLQDDKCRYSAASSKLLLETVALAKAKEMPLERGLALQMLSVYSTVSSERRNGLTMACKLFEDVGAHHHHASCKACLSQIELKNELAAGVALSQRERGSQRRVSVSMDSVRKIEKSVGKSMRMMGTMANLSSKPAEPSLSSKRRALHKLTRMTTTSAAPREAGLDLLVMEATKDPRETALRDTSLRRTGRDTDRAADRGACGGQAAARPEEQDDEDDEVSKAAKAAVAMLDGESPERV